MPGQTPVMQNWWVCHPDDLAHNQIVRSSLDHAFCPAEHEAMRTLRIITVAIIRANTELRDYLYIGSPHSVVRLGLSVGERE